MLKSHVGLRSQPKTSAEDVGHSGALLVKGVDNRGAGRSARSLKHVTQNAEHAVETLVVLSGSTSGGVCFPGNTGHHLGNDSEIDDEGTRQEGVLTNVGHRNTLVATHEDLAVVLIHGTFVVTHSRHVLYDDCVVRVLVLFVQDGVGSHHIVHNVALADFLGAELLGGVEVQAVVVAQEVEGSNRSELDAGVDEEVNQCRLHLGLTGLEVITTNESLLLLGELNAAWNKSILRRTVDERNPLKDGSNRKDGGGRDLAVAGLDGIHEVGCGVVDTGYNLGITFSVGGPEDDYLVKTIGVLEGAER